MNDLPATMRALQLQEAGKLVQVQLPVPRPGPHEVMIRTIASTICTSDLNDIDHNPFNIQLPRVLGHEGAGVVVSTGESVKNFMPSDCVAIHPVIPCNRCDNCRRGLGHLCSDLGHLGLDRDGTFAEYFCIPEERVRKLPPGMDFATGALLEPVAVCLEAVERGRIGKGETVIVVGDGPFGIIIARLVSSWQPAKVIMVGRRDFRLRQVPDAIVINERNTSDLSAAILEASGGAGVDVAILAVGNQRALDIGVASLRARGRLVVFSAIPSPAQVDMFSLHTKELEILGACNDRNLIDLALDKLTSPELLLSSLVTHRIPFEEWTRGFALAKDGKDEALKVALVFANSNETEGA